MKILFRGLSVLLIIVSIFLVSLIIGNEAFLPSKTMVNEINCKYDTSILANFKALKNCPQVILPAAKKAVAAFPKLKDVKIKFVFKKLQAISATMMAQPKFSTTFFNPENKEYIIYINNNEGRSKGLNYSEMSFDIQVGWIAHELGHILDYKNRNALSMIGFGVNYVVLPKFKEKVEHTADILAINRGLGKELLTGVEFLLSHPNISERYKNKIKKFYLSVDKIKEYIIRYEASCNYAYNEI